LPGAALRGIIEGELARIGVQPSSKLRPRLRWSWYFVGVVNKAGLIAIDRDEITPGRVTLLDFRKLWIQLIRTRNDTDERSVEGFGIEERLELNSTDEERIDR
jgi:hypothetical protein